MEKCLAKSIKDLGCIVSFKKGDKKKSYALLKKIMVASSKKVV